MASGYKYGHDDVCAHASSEPVIDPEWIRREVVRPGDSPWDRLLFSYATDPMPGAADISESIRKLTSDFILVRFGRFTREKFQIVEGKEKILSRRREEDPNIRRVTSWLAENFPDCTYHDVWPNGTLEVGDQMIAICGDHRMLDKMRLDFEEDLSSGDIKASFVVFNEEMAKRFDMEFLESLQNDADVPFPGFWFAGWISYGNFDDQRDWIRANVKGSWLLYSHERYREEGFYFSDPNEALEFWFAKADRCS